MSERGNQHFVESSSLVLFGPILNEIQLLKKTQKYTKTQWTVCPAIHYLLVNSSRF